MVIHIGKIIHELVEKNQIKAKTLAEQINVSESTVYKIYQRESIDVDKLIRLSRLFKENLFLHYMTQEPLKSMMEPESKKLHEEIGHLKAALSAKQKRIQELEDINASQQQVIGILQENSSGKKK